jgi:galactoside O-acetyltransferase
MMARGLEKDFTGEKELAGVNEQRFAVKMLKMMSILAFLALQIPVRLPFAETFTRNYSRGIVGFFLRSAYYHSRLKYVGKDVFIDVGVTIWNPQGVEIGDGSHIDTYCTLIAGDAPDHFIKIGRYCHISSYCVLSGKGGLTIGDYAAISAGCKVYPSTNYYRNLATGELCVACAAAPMNMQYIIVKGIKIGKCSFVGVNSVLIPGAELGDYTIVGACSLVNSRLPSRCVATGIPARVVKEL